MKDNQSYLEGNITFYTRFGWGFVICAIFPLAYAFKIVVWDNQYWQESDLGTFIGGVSGTFAALAGIFFIYVAFLGQRLQILFQKQELEMNRQELKETREEIKGQKEQLELQNKQFQIQSFESTFFRLTDYYKSQVLNYFSPYDNDLGALGNFFEKTQIKFNNDVRDKILESRNRSFDLAFSEMKSQVEAIIRCAYSVTIHVYLNRDLVKEDYYWDIFYRQLSTPELNMLFYGYFSSLGMYEPYYEQIFAYFLKKVEKRRLYQNNDIALLDAIEKPNIGFLQNQE